MLLIEDGLVLTPGGVERGDVLVDYDTGLIEAVGEVPRGRVTRTLDASDGLVMPGLVNTHTHLAMTLFRGYADDLPLGEWLGDYIWPVEEHLTDEDVRAGAFLGCLELIKSGVTAFADMYVHMDMVVEAVHHANLRAHLAYGMIDLGDPERAESELREGRRFAQRWDGHDFITTRYGPHSPQTCSPDFLRMVREQASEDGLGIHIHVAETQEGVREVEHSTGSRPMKLLEEIGFLGPDVLAAHCVWLSPGEIRAMQAHGVKVSHCPTSNMKLASGVAPIPDLLDAGVTVSLGTDGAASNNSMDLFGEMKVAPLLQKVTRMDATALPAEAVVSMATRGGAKALGINAGVIEPGRLGDVIVVDLGSANMNPHHDLLSHLVYSAKPCDVRHTVVGGLTLMEDRDVWSLEEDRVIRDARRSAERLISKVRG